MRGGFRAGFSLRAHGLALAALCGVLLARRLAPLWWAPGLLAAAVIAAELFNTALEQLADHLHPGEHIRTRAVKDSAAAALPVVAAGAVAILAALLVDSLHGR